MPGVSIGNIGSPPPPAAPADIAEIGQPAPEAVPCASAEEKVTKSAKDDAHEPSVAKPKKAGK